jgi:NAD+ kinase
VKRFHHIGILYNPLSEEPSRFSEQLQHYLEQRGLEVWRGTEKNESEATIARLDLLIALGGDGTMLRAAHMAIPHNIPLLTVALGRLNFLAELTPDDLYEGLNVVLSGKGWIDRRSLIQATFLRGPHTLDTLTALNEVVLSRGDVSHTITVNVQIDEIPLTTYRADGVLVSTATGSTAYALSAGGPILDPRSRAMVLVPVAAHLTAVPSMVLHEESVVTLFVESCRHATLAVDGHGTLPVQEGDRVQIYRSNKVCRFLRIHPTQRFFATLVRRLRRE